MSKGQANKKVRALAHDLGIIFRISKRGVPYAVWSDGFYRLSIAWFTRNQFYRVFTCSVDTEQSKFDFTDEELLKAFVQGYMGKELTDE